MYAINIIAVKLSQFCTSSVSQDFSQGWKYFHSMRRNHLQHLRSLLDPKDDLRSCCGNVSHNNSSFQLYTHPDYHKLRTTDTAELRSVTVIHSSLQDARIRYFLISRKTSSPKAKYTNKKCRKQMI